MGLVSIPETLNGVNFCLGDGQLYGYIVGHDNVTRIEVMKSRNSDHPLGLKVSFSDDSAKFYVNVAFYYEGKA